MSKKYVPRFLKEQQAQNTAAQWPTAHAAAQRPLAQWPSAQRPSAALATGNRFSALSDDFPMSKKTSPLVQSSVEAHIFGKARTSATTLATTSVPATLASLTSNTTSVDKGANKSYASKFIEKQKQVEDPNYKPPVKPLDFKSDDDFPTLGFGSKSTLASAGKASVAKEENVVKLPPVTKSGYADLARGWAKKKEEEDAAEFHRRHTEEVERLERELMRSTMVRHTFKKETRKYEDDEDGEEQLDDEDAVSEYSSVSEGRGEEEFISEGDEDQDGEINPNTVYNRRHKEDLY